MQQDSVFQMRDIAAALPVVTPDSKLGDILSPEVQQTTFAHTIGPEWWKEYTVEEFLEFATKHIENKDISHLRNYVQALLPEQPVIDWSALKTLNFLGDHPTSNHYLVLSPAFRRESSLRSAPSTKTIYKTLVISGESGSGKSMFATYGVAARISDEKTTANSKTHVITLYHKLSGEHDLTASLRYVESLGTRSIEKRNNACLKILLKLWLNCSATICKDHFHGDKSAWNEAEIVFVLDEASSFPIFVRGAIAVSGEFQRKVLYEGEHQPVSLQLVLVGTALSYHTNPEDSSIASDPELYVSKQLISWNADNFKTYAREFLRRDVSNEIIEGVVDMVLSIPSLSTLGRNGRCANFLVAALRTRINSYWSNRSLSFILNSIRLSVSSIIYAVADQYRIANGFGDLFNSKPSEFEESSLLCLKFSMQPDLVVAEEKERVQNLLIYGILSYADGKFCISSTILLLCLCRFGTGDQLLVTNCDEFKHVVALRAMVKARIDNPARPVRIVVCIHFQVYKAIVRPVNRKNEAGELYELNVVVPSSVFHIVNNSPELINPDETVILINGAQSPGPDIIVLGDKEGTLLQAKFYENGYNPSADALNIELLKLGVVPPNIDTTGYRATIEVLKSLTKNRVMQRTFVTSSGGDLNFAVSYKDALDDTRTTRIGVKHEVIEPVWRELVVSTQKDVVSYTLKL